MSSFITSEVMALDRAREELLKLENVLGRADAVKEMPEQYNDPVAHAKAFLTEKKDWVEQASKDVFKLGPPVMVQADKVCNEAKLATDMIESYLSDLT